MGGAQGRRCPAGRGECAIEGFEAKSTAANNRECRPLIVGWVSKLSLGMDVIFERDSVCAGDDVSAPTRRTVEFDCPQLLSELCGGKHALNYLPSMSGARTK